MYIYFGSYTTLQKQLLSQLQLMELSGGKIHSQVEEVFNISGRARNCNCYGNTAVNCFDTVTINLNKVSLYISKKQN